MKACQTISGDKEHTALQIVGKEGVRKGFEKEMM